MPQLRTRYYIGSALANGEVVKLAQNYMNEYSGWDQTYDWATIGKVDLKDWASISVSEVEGVLSSDVFIGILPGRNGFHTEFGLALGDPRRRVYLIGSPKDFEDNYPVSYPSCFYFHPRVRRITIPDITDSRKLIGALATIITGSKILPEDEQATLFDAEAK